MNPFSIFIISLEIIGIFLSSNVKVLNGMSPIQPGGAICGNKSIDIILAIDSSGSMLNIFNNTIDFAERLVSNFLIAEDHVKVGVIDFSMIANVLLPLSSGNNLGRVYQALEELRHRPQNGETHTDLALQLAAKMFKESQLRAGKDLPRAFVIITDGELTSGSYNELDAGLLDLAILKVTNFVVQGGDDPVHEGLHKLASKPEYDFIFGLTPNALREPFATRALAESICQDTGSHETESKQGMQQNVNSTQQQATSTQQQATATQQKVAATQQAASPQPQVEALPQQQTSSTHQQAASTQQQNNATQQATSPQQQVEASAQHQTSSVQQQAVSTQQMAVLTQQQAASTQQQATATQQQAAATQQQAAGTQKVASPQQLVAASAQQQTSSSQHPAASTQQATSPQQLVAASAQQQTSPSQQPIASKQQATSSQQQGEAPAQQQKLSTQQLAASTQQQAVSADQQAAAAQQVASQVAPPTEVVAGKCNINYTKVGCFNDFGVIPKPLPLKIDEDKRNGFSVGVNNPSFKKSEWEKFLPDFICQCANAARQKKLWTFGIQNYEECYSGYDEGRHDEDGTADPSKCKNNKGQICNEKSEFCSGEQNSNFVYTVLTERHPGIVKIEYD